MRREIVDSMAGETYSLSIIVCTVALLDCARIRLLRPDRGLCLETVPDAADGLDPVGELFKLLPEATNMGVDSA